MKLFTVKKTVLLIIRILTDIQSISQGWLVSWGMHLQNSIRAFVDIYVIIFSQCKTTRTLGLTDSANHG